MKTIITMTNNLTHMIFYHSFYLNWPKCIDRLAINVIAQSLNLRMILLDKI